MEKLSKQQMIDMINNHIEEYESSDKSDMIEDILPLLSEEQLEKIIKQQHLI